MRNEVVGCRWLMAMICFWGMRDIFEVSLVWMISINGFRCLVNDLVDVLFHSDIHEGGITYRSNSI